MRHRFTTGVPPTNDQMSSTGSSMLAPGRSIADERVDLGAVSHDAGIGEQSGPVVVAVGGHALDVEVIEGGAIPLALAKDRDPGEPGLGTLEAEELEEPMRIAHRDSPLGVVVADEERVGARPGAAGRVGHRPSTARAMRK